MEGAAAALGVGDLPPRCRPVDRGALTGRQVQRLPRPIVRQHHTAAAIEEDGADGEGLHQARHHVADGRGCKIAAPAAGGHAGTKANQNRRAQQEHPAHGQSLGGLRQAREEQGHMQQKERAEHGEVRQHTTEHVPPSLFR
ncbi:MAG: hypothetical protein ACYC5O_06340 [Anaerolineae bacterium]